MPEGERATREGLSRGLSDYYNSLGRLAAFRRKFESVGVFDWRSSGTVTKFDHMTFSSVLARCFK